MKKLFFILILVSNMATAESFQKTGTIKNVYFHSVDSTVTNWAGKLQLEIDTTDWGTVTTCSTSYVAVRNSDTHLISAVLAAKMADMPITVYADGAMVDGTSYCILRAAGI